MIYFVIFPERSWLEQGRRVGEHVIPLVRNLNSSSINVDPGITPLVSLLTLVMLVVLLKREKEKKECLPISWKITYFSIFCNEFLFLETKSLFP